MLTKALAILALSCSLALAQPASDQPTSPTERQRANHDSRESKEALQDRLTQTLEFAKRIVEKHETALEQLDAGQSPSEVMRELRSPQSRQMMRDAKRSQSSNQSHNHQPAQGLRPPPPTLSEQDLKEARGFIAKHLPRIGAQLQQIESLNPKATDRLVAQLSPKILEVIRIRESDPTLASLKLEELKAGLSYVDAARKYRGLLRSGSQDQSQIDLAKQEVEEAANARFDAQVHIKQYEIHQLSSRINQLHEALEELNAQRDEQVQAQVLTAKNAPRPRFNRQPTRRSQSDEKPQPEHADD